MFVRALISIRDVLSRMVTYPEVLSSPNLSVRYKFDGQSLFEHYQNIFSFAALQYNTTEVNQRQLWYYAAGRSKPPQKQAQKIVSAFNKFGKELVSLSV